MIDSVETCFGFCLAQGRSECAKCQIGLPPHSILGQCFKIDQRIDKLGVWRQWSARGRDHVGYFWVLQSEFEQRLSNLSGCTKDEYRFHELIEPIAQ
jgi:hypothetical protein